MLRNCFTFNPPENHVYKSGEEVQKLFQQGILKVKAEASKKRSAGEKSSGSHKKAKY